MGKFSKNLNNRLLNKGPDHGFCAICRVSGPLTRDHVPPKNCGNIHNAIIRDVFADSHVSHKRNIISQGGLHFKTICNWCNNTLLGTNYDPALIRVVQEVRAYIINAYASRLALPSIQFFDYQPNKFLRSVLGHLLAANAVSDVTKDDNLGRIPPLDAELREYVLNPTSLLPSHISVYYWLYPSQRRVIMKHSAMGFAGSGGNIIYGHVFKFFPFGFWVIRDEQMSNISHHIDLPKLNLDISCEIEANSRLLINFSSLQKLNFPEDPLDNRMWLVANHLVSQATDAIKK